MSAFQTPACLRSKRSRVYQHHWHHANMCFNMCGWCWYTLERCECTHAGVLNARTEVFQRDTTHHHHHNTSTPYTLQRNPRTTHLQRNLYSTHLHTHEHAPSTHTTQHAQALNCLINCPPSGNQFDTSAPHLSLFKNK